MKAGRRTPGPKAAPVRGRETASNLKSNLDHGQWREEFRKEYEHLDAHALSKLSHEASVRATVLMALAWEKLWASPKGN